MASSALKTPTTLHTRSNSLPSRPSPQILDLEENLRRLSSGEASTSSSSLSKDLSVLRDLYDSVDGFLHLPHTQQKLIHENHRSYVDELMNASLCFLDVCGTAKDVLTQIKEHAQDLQSMLRRKRGDDSELVKEAAKYLASRKSLKKEIGQSLRNLKANYLSSETNGDATLDMLRQVQEITVTKIESLLSFISGPKAQSRGSSWSLVSKLVHSKRVSCEEDASEAGEFKSVDSLLNDFVRKSMNVDKEDLQKELRKLELSIQDLEDELEPLLRRIIKTRAFLLNILTN